ANTPSLAVMTTKFQSALVITSSCLSYLLPITKSLQSEAHELVQAVSENYHFLDYVDIRHHIVLSHCKHQKRTISEL
uniref:Uncharacterized protein n=1 Tax=Amphimedon queenslandica TaxID=400682 RepID=A0A1X7VX83_AMPQE